MHLVLTRRAVGHDCLIILVLIFYCLHSDIILVINPSHQGQLSLVIPVWIGSMSTGDGYGHR